MGARSSISMEGETAGTRNGDARSKDAKREEQGSETRVLQSGLATHDDVPGKLPGATTYS